ncbi:MAG: hypothetical protein ACOC44_13140 [Promethearchaeia archaeon]
MNKHLFQRIPQASVGGLALMIIIAGKRGLNDDLTIDVPFYLYTFQS